MLVDLQEKVKWLGISYRIKRNHNFNQIFVNFNTFFSPPPLPTLEGRWCAGRLADKGALTSARHHGLYSRLATVGMARAADCLCVTDCRVSGAMRIGA